MKTQSLQWRHSRSCILRDDGRSDFGLMVAWDIDVTILLQNCSVSNRFLKIFLHCLTFAFLSPIKSYSTMIYVFLDSEFP